MSSGYRGKGTEVSWEKIGPVSKLIDGVNDGDGAVTTKPPPS